MGYRDDFYAVSNIVGYTGALQDLPTVYFENKSEWGHITQKHDLANNVGRELVRSTEGYRAGNSDEGDDHVRLVEWAGDHVIHESRNKMTTVEGMSADDQAILAQSIWRYQSEKTRYIKPVK